MQIERQKLFTNRQLIRLIMPLMVEQALAFLVGMVDGIMASSVSETAMSGVSLVNNISAVILNLLTALSTGGAVVVSQYLGARQKETAKHACGQLITMAVGVSVVLMAISMLFAKQLLQLFFGDIEADVMNAAFTMRFPSRSLHCTIPAQRFSVAMATARCRCMSAFCAMW